MSRTFERLYDNTKIRTNFIQRGVTIVIFVEESERLIRNFP